MSPSGTASIWAATAGSTRCCRPCTSPRRAATSPPKPTWPPSAPSTRPPESPPHPQAAARQRRHPAPVGRPPTAKLSHPEPLQPDNPNGRLTKEPRVHLRHRQAPHPGHQGVPAPRPRDWRWRSNSSSPPSNGGVPSTPPTWSPWSALARGSRTASSSNDPTHQEAISKPRDQGGHETGRHVGQRELPVRFGCLTGGVHGRTQICRVGR